MNTGGGYRCIQVAIMEQNRLTGTGTDIYADYCRIADDTDLFFIQYILEFMAHGFSPY